MYEEIKTKILHAKSPRELADAIKTLLTHPPGTVESKKLLDMVIGMQNSHRSARK